MEEQVNRLVAKVWAKFETTPPNERFLIAISGIPGSGKTTLAATVCNRLNALSPEPSRITAIVPTDGYHLTRAQLSAMPDPATAHFRRGADFTFDSAAYLALIKSLRAPITAQTGTIYAPSFNHALKDPIANDIPIPPSARIVIVEGLYLALEKEPWAEARTLMDENWWVEVPAAVAEERLVKRHVETGICATREEARNRVRGNDLVNARMIVEGRGVVDEVILS